MNIIKQLAAHHYGLTRQMQNKIINYEDQFPNKQTFLILITPLGLKRNAWSEDLIHHVITLEGFWRENQEGL